MSALTQQEKLNIRGKLALATALLRKAESEADDDNYDAVLKFIHLSLKELQPINSDSLTVAIMDEYQEEL